jgi:toxin ParE1/3/4
VRITWARDAHQDVKAAADYVGKRDPGAARRLAKRLTGAAPTIASHPGIGRPGRIDGTREFFVSGTPYIVVFRPAHDRLEIVRVLHTSRLWPDSV